MPIVAEKKKPLAVSLLQGTAEITPDFLNHGEGISSYALSRDRGGYLFGKQHSFFQQMVNKTDTVYCFTSIARVDYKRSHN